MAYTKEEFYQEFNYNKHTKALVFEFVVINANIKVVYFLMQKTLSYIYLPNINGNPLIPSTHNFENIEFSQIYDTLSNWNNSINLFLKHNT